MKRAVITVAAVVVLGGMAGMAAGGIVYVDADARGADNGTCWADAYRFLQDGLADANSADKPVEIWVAAGTYRPDRSSAEPNGTGDREATFQLINGVTIKGGYAGFGEPDRNARDIKLYDTILSGDLDGNDVDVNVNDLYDLVKEPSRAENSYHVATGSGTDEAAVLEGCTITAGHANRRVLDPDILDPNSRGGGMYNYGGSPKVGNCKFSGNVAAHAAGLFNWCSSPTIVKCAFVGNISCGGKGVVAIGGGGMVNYQSSPRLTGCTFSENWASGHGGAMANYEDSHAVLTNCIFYDNLTFGYGGGMYSSWSSPTLVSCTFRGNEAAGGGGIYCRHGSPRISNCVISGNTANLYWYGFGGGGICCGCGAEPIIADCLISGNRAFDGGGIVFWGCSGRLRHVNISGCVIAGNSATMWGGGIYCSSMVIKIANCTVISNAADLGGGIFLGQALWPMTAVKNCIIWGNRDSAGSGESAQIEIMGWIEEGPAINHNCIQGLTGALGGNGNIGADPCLAQTGFWDPNGTPGDPNDDFWVDGDYHLKSHGGRWEPNSQTWAQDDGTSACIDAGDMGSLIGYEPFPNGGIINMGAYGGTAEASKSYFGERLCETIIAGDINGDCRVDFVDFSLMAGHWLEYGFPVVSDCTVESSFEHCIEIDRAFFHLGQDVPIVFRVTNFLMGYPADRIFTSVGPMLDIIVEAREGEDPKEVWRWSWDESYVTPHRLHLGHGRSAEFTCVWPQVNFCGTPEKVDDTEALPGTYRISAVFFPTQGRVRLDVSIIP